MNINMTLCVQIINFGVIYLVLRYALFKPVANIIVQQEEHRAKVDYAIANKEAMLARVHYNRQLILQDFKKYCCFNVPVSCEFEVGQPLDLVLPEVSVPQEDIEKKAVSVAHIIVQALKKRVNE